ncbi:MAG: hypothetical protein K0Q79_3508 [Flavipsychrobacter sp.]|jgi:hypothetical protein|nr:hypothetical protein [Flavipsychrobacter sp.]
MQNMERPNEAGVNFFKEQIATIKKIMALKDEDILKLIEANCPSASIAEEKNVALPLAPRISEFYLN